MVTMHRAGSTGRCTSQRIQPLRPVTPNLVLLNRPTVSPAAPIEAELTARLCPAIWLRERTISASLRIPAVGSLKVMKQTMWRLEIPFTSPFLITIWKPHQFPLIQAIVKSVKALTFTSR